MKTEGKYLLSKISHARVYARKHARAIAQTNEAIRRDAGTAARSPRKREPNSIVTSPFTRGSIPSAIDTNQQEGENGQTFLPLPSTGTVSLYRPAPGPIRRAVFMFPDAVFI